MIYRISADSLGKTTYTNCLEDAFKVFDWYTIETNQKLNDNYMTIAEMEKEKGEPITIKDLCCCGEIFFSMEEKINEEDF